MSTLDDDLSQLKAVGAGAVSLFNATILLAIVAVLLSTRAGTAGILAQFLGLITWLVSQVVTPVTGGTNIPLTTTLQPAFGWGGTGTPGTTSTGTGGSPGPIDNGTFGTGPSTVGTGPGTGGIPELTVYPSH